MQEKNLGKKKQQQHTTQQTAVCDKTSKQLGIEENFLKNEKENH